MMNPYGFIWVLVLCSHNAPTRLRTGMTTKRRGNTASKTIRVNITPDRIRKLAKDLEESDKTELSIWDETQKALGVRAVKGRAPLFVFTYRQDGKFRKITIGACSGMTIEDARKKAAELYKTVYVDDADPQAEAELKTKAREQAKAKEEKDSLTLGSAWNTYIESNRHRWSEHHLNDHGKMMAAPGLPRRRSTKLTVAGLLWDLRKVRLIDLPAKVPDWAREQAKHRPTQTKLCLRLLKTFLLEHDIALAETIGRSGQAKLRKALPKATIKKISLQAGHLKAWWTGTLLLPPATSSYLRFQLLTGARPTEGATLTWDNADLKWDTLTIRDKINGERTIPLTPYVKKLLLELRDYGQVIDIKRTKRKYEPVAAPQGGDAPDYVFRAMTGPGHLTNADKGHNKVLAYAGLPKEMNLHALRKTFETLWEEADLPEGAANQITGHAAQTVKEKHYMNRSMDRIQDLMTRYENWILQQAGVDTETDAIINRPLKTLIKAA